MSRTQTGAPPKRHRYPQRPLRYAWVNARRRLRESAYRLGLRRADAYVTEFPRSGASWVTWMCREMRAPGAAETLEVVHSHWRWSPALRPAVYVMRDGRDAMLSLYYYHLRLREVTPPSRAHIDAFFADVLGPDADLDDVRGNLPAFIASLRDKPFGGILRARGNRRYLPWPEHVRDWVRQPEVLALRYEDLIVDTPAQLARISEHLGLGLAPETLSDIAARHSFKARTGREPGTEDPRGHVRKGIAGDWKNHYTRAAGEAFQSFAGEALVELGYEPDARWLEGLPES